MLFCKAKGVFYTFKELINLEDDMEVNDYPHWQLAKDEQNGKVCLCVCVCN